jgi:glycosyltransferase involved in cell wall biosynthesis
VQTLLSAWAQMRNSYPLVVIGDGPLSESLGAQVAAQNISSVTFRGWLPRAQTLEAMKQSAFLVAPSVWYEGFPMAIAEAFACGTPVLCSRLGAMQEIVDDGRTGLHFEPGNAEDLATKLTELLAQPEKTRAMGIAARREYESRYTAKTNYSLLMRIYEQSISNYSRN